MTVACFSIACTQCLDRSVIRVTYLTKSSWYSDVQSSQRHTLPPVYLPECSAFQHYVVNEEPRPIALIGVYIRSTAAMYSFTALRTDHPHPCSTGMSPTLQAVEAQFNALSINSVVFDVLNALFGATSFPWASSHRLQLCLHRCLRRLVHSCAVVYPQTQGVSLQETQDRDSRLVRASFV